MLSSTQPNSQGRLGCRALCFSPCLESGPCAAPKGAGSAGCPLMASIGVFQSIFGISEPALGFSPFHKGPLCRAACGLSQPLELDLEFLRCCQVSNNFFYFFYFFPRAPSLLFAPRLRGGFPFLGNMIGAAKIPTKERGCGLAGNAFCSF